MRTENANGLLMGRKNRDFISADISGLGYAPDLMLGHSSIGSPFPDGLSPEEEKTAWRERIEAERVQRDYWKNANEYTKRKYPELYSRMRYVYGF